MVNRVVIAHIRVSTKRQQPSIAFQRGWQTLETQAKIAA